MKLISPLILSLFCVLPFTLGKRFVCYFPNWATYRTDGGSYKVDNIDPNLCTDLVYAFAVLDGSTYTIKIVDPWTDIDNQGYAKFVALKSKNSKLKTTIAIGGWNDSHDGTNKYSIMVASEANRKTFIDSVKNFLTTHGFDGLDLDWEYPMSASDKTGFASLLRELRAAFGSQYLLSVAVAANQTIIDLGYDIETMKNEVDYINLMAYDMHGSWESTTDHHAPLYKRDWETVDNNNVDFIVNYWLNNGFPASKINMGIPLYGNSWTLGESVEAEAVTDGSGPGAAGPITGEPGTLGYHEICNYIRNEGWQSVEDSEHLNGPYAFSSSNPKVWVGYDDISMATVKSDYVLKNNLGGAMVWDISTDDFRNKCGDGPDPLMKTISNIVVPAGSRFVCYFPNWGYYRTGDGNYVVENINANLCTDLVYAFAVLNGTTNKIQVFDSNVDINQGFYTKFVALKTQNPLLKTTIAIGGWTDSHDGTNKYSDMVASAANRKTFIDSVMQFLTDYHFDGLDLDWEYPMTESDKSGFASLLRELRVAFGSQYLLSVAVAANQTIIDLGYDVPVMDETADYINVMAYDMHGPWESKTDHHAPLYRRSWDTDPTNNVDSIIKHWQSKGLSASKINMGIPLYGKSWTLASTYTSDPTLPAPGLGHGAAGPLTKQAGFLGYHEICNYTKNYGWNVAVDPSYKIGPYASSPNTPMTWVGYDDVAMANVKSRYVLDKNLGGAMVWDISTDDFRNTCGDGVNPIMTNISRTVLIDEITSSTTITPTTTTIPTTTTTSTTISTERTTRTPTEKRTTLEKTTVTTISTEKASTITVATPDPNSSNRIWSTNSLLLAFVSSFGCLIFYLC